MNFEKLATLLKKTATWLESEIPDARVKENDSTGRRWYIKSIGYSKTLKIEDLKTITDRGTLNSEFVKRYKDTDAKTRKGVSALKTEISALYSFSKCFVQRYKGRMHFYRDDLSQKGTRTVTAVGQSSGLLEELKNNLSQ